MSADGGVWRANWSQIMVAVLITFSVGTCVNFILIGMTMRRQGEQSAAGEDARARQCELAPISDKEQQWFHASGVISFKELEKYREGAPTPEECAAMGVRPR